MKRLFSFHLCIGIILFAGCAEPPAFQFNVVAKKQAEQDQPFSSQQIEDIANVLTAFFGTPDQPAFPNVRSFHFPEGLDYGEAFAEVVDFQDVIRAAGPVRFDESGKTAGLYREHCSHCHGISGDGSGPTAVTLTPYPRDFRNGVFKFKSTIGKARPSNEDLYNIINDGIPGTAMPAFNVAITQSEKKALVDYVKYLSIRGEIEQVLWDITASLEEDQRLPLVFPRDYDELDEEEKDELYGWFEEEGIRIESIFKSWTKASSSPSIKKPTAPPEYFSESHDEHANFLAKGRAIFSGKSGACIQCHGDTGYGDGELGNYDIWNQWAKGKNDKYIAGFVDAGVLPPRTISPRNFRNGGFRGGRNPLNLFYRIKNGIQGSQMPGAATLTDEEVWALVAYVRNIKNETITGGHQQKPIHDKKIN